MPQPPGHDTENQYNTEVYLDSRDGNLYAAGIDTPIPLAPAQLPSSVVSRDSDYLITLNSMGIAQAINGTTGAIDFTSVLSTDHSAVFQSAINALAIHNGGTGGKIAFKGQFVWTNPVTLYPGISFVGQGPLGNKGTQNTGASIQSKYNGDTLVVTGVRIGEAYFPYLANFSIWGQATASGYASQNLIALNASGGSFVWDTYIDHVNLFDAGQHGIYVDASSNGKLWIEAVYLEGCVGDGLRLGAGTCTITGDTYIFGCSGSGVNSPGGSFLSIENTRIWFNGQTSGYGLNIGSCNDFRMMNCSLNNNGYNGNYQCVFGGVSGQNIYIIGNDFKDSRGATAVNRHLDINPGGQVFGGVITGNVFQGHKAAEPLWVVPRSGTPGNTLIIAANDGHNNKRGVVTSPFSTSTYARIGPEGSSAAPTASVAYKSQTPVFLNVSGGTGVSITISDPNGTAIVSGASSYTGLLPVGYSINFGAFSVAPTTCIVAVA